MKKIFVSMAMFMMATSPSFAQTTELTSCEILPTCEDFGYTNTVAQCQKFGVDYIPCPFDETKVNCLLANIPSTCSVGQCYNPTNNTCTATGNFTTYNLCEYLIVDVQDVDGFKILTTAVLTSAQLMRNCLNDDGSATPCAILTGNSVHSAARICYNSGYDNGLLTNDQLVYVESIADSYPFYENVGSEVYMAENGRSWISSNGYIVSSDGNVIKNTTVLTPNSSAGIGLICKKTFPSRIVVEE